LLGDELFAEPATASATTTEPAAVAAEPATAEPTAAEPATAEPTAAEPATAEPTAAEPAAANSEPAAVAEPTSAITAEPAVAAEPAVTAAEPAAANFALIVLRVQYELPDFALDIEMSSRNLYHAIFRSRRLLPGSAHRSLQQWRYNRFVSGYHLGPREFIYWFDMLIWLYRRDDSISNDRLANAMQWCISNWIW
jgi:hypothetical protein